MHPQTPNIFHKKNRPLICFILFQRDEHLRHRAPGICDAHRCQGSSVLITGIFPDLSETVLYCTVRQIKKKKEEIILLKLSSLKDTQINGIRETGDVMSLELSGWTGDIDHEVSLWRLFMDINIKT